MKKGDILEFEIIDLAFGGRGVGKVKMKNEELRMKTPPPPPFQGGKEFIVFVDGALPGQQVRVRITEKKKNYAEAKLLEILKRSPLEVETGYQDVPGAPWARLPHEKQIEFKEAQVKDLFRKFAKMDIEPILDEIISSPIVWNYRNKMEFSFGFSDEDFEMVESKETLLTPLSKRGGKKVWKHFGFALGSKKRGQFHLVENLESPSGLFDEEFEKCIPRIREFCEETKLQPYNQKTNEGFFRHLVVRKSFYQDKFLINLVTTSGRDVACNVSTDFPEKFVKFLTDRLGNRIGGIFWSQNDAISDTAHNFEQRELLYGSEYLIEKINDLEFEISLDSFFQTNVKSAELLYKKVASYCDGGCVQRKENQIKPPPTPPFQGGKRSVILDLFCGTGTIGQILAKTSPNTQIIGVEIVESAVEDAKKNAKRNSLSNIEFHCDDVRVYLKSQVLQNPGLVDTIILDPPRGGIAPKALQRVIDFRAPQIIYVSCNPATMARDTEIFQKSGYTLQKISIVDQFPHTSHVECVGKFVRESFL